MCTYQIGEQRIKTRIFRCLEESRQGPRWQVAGKGKGRTKTQPQSLILFENKCGTGDRAQWVECLSSFPKATGLSPSAV